jgi:hypothetical protein
LLLSALLPLLLLPLSLSASSARLVVLGRGGSAASAAAFPTTAFTGAFTGALAAAAAACAAADVLP